MLSLYLRCGCIDTFAESGVAEAGLCSLRCSLLSALPVYRLISWGKHVTQYEARRAIVVSVSPPPPPRPAYTGEASFLPFPEP